jgi:hypothetical protein
MIEPLLPDPLINTSLIHTMPTPLFRLASRVVLLLLLRRWLPLKLLLEKETIVHSRQQLALSEFESGRERVHLSRSMPLKRQKLDLKITCPVVCRLRDRYPRPPSSIVEVLLKFVERMNAAETTITILQKLLITLPAYLPCTFPNTYPPLMIFPRRSARNKLSQRLGRWTLTKTTTRTVKMRSASPDRGLEIAHRMVSLTANRSKRCQRNRRRQIPPKFTGSLGYGSILLLSYLSCVHFSPSLDNAFPSTRHHEQNDGEQKSKLEGGVEKEEAAHWLLGLMQALCLETWGEAT